MVINFDTGILQATLAENTPPIKAGSQVPVTVLCVANGEPTNFGGTVALFMGLTSSVGNSPLTLAYLNTFTAGSNSTFTGTLNAADPRLTLFFTNIAQQDLNLEVGYSVNGGPPYIAPNVLINCQQLQSPAGGGPSYVTEAQLTAALLNIVDANGNLLVGLNGRFQPTATGMIAQTSPDEVAWNNSQQWP